MIRGSFVPPAAVQEVRDLTRTRKQLVRQIAQHTQRIQKTLDVANLKITGLMSNILGVSGRAILRALITGETDPEELADLARGSLTQKRAALIEALTGRVTPHQRRLIKLHLDLVERLEATVEEIDAHLGDGSPLFVRRSRASTSFRGLPPSWPTRSSARSASTSRAFRRISTSFRGPVCAAAWTRAPANASPRARAKARVGSKPCWSKLPGRRSGKRTVTIARNSSGSGAPRAEKGVRGRRPLLADHGLLHPPQRCRVSRTGAANTLSVSTERK